MSMQLVPSLARGRSSKTIVLIASITACLLSCGSEVGRSLEQRGTADAEAEDNKDFLRALRAVPELSDSMVTDLSGERPVVSIHCVAASPATLTRRLIVAAWRSGRIVWQSEHHADRPHYLEGFIDADSVLCLAEELVDAIRNAAITNPTSAGVDAENMVLFAITGRGAIELIDCPEWITPQGDRLRKRIEMQRALTLIRALIPADGRPCSPDAFRISFVGPSRSR